MADVKQEDGGSNQRRSGLLLFWLMRPSLFALLRKTASGYALMTKVSDGLGIDRLVRLLIDLVWTRPRLDYNVHSDNIAMPVSDAIFC